jgi:hypothetical protein
MATDSPIIVDLDHQANYLRGALLRSLCLAADRHGAATLVDFRYGRTHTVRGLPKIRDISLHPSRHAIALIDDDLGSLSVVDFDGASIIEKDGRGHHMSAPDWENEGFEGCVFDQNADFLWCVLRLSPETLEVQLRETQGWSVVCSVAIEDPFEESHCSFHPTCRPEMTALWLAAGQNGQRVYWITRNQDSLDAELEPFLEDTTPPVFAPNSNEFLVIEDFTCVRKYQFPTDRKLGVCRLKRAEEEIVGDCLCYLDATTALVRSDEGRLLRIDVRVMKIADEIVVPGHEPRPTEEYYPSLVGDMNLCTDISSFDSFGEIAVLGYHRQNLPTKDTLMFYEASALAKISFIKGIDPFD